jgi:hypothetical protein
MKIIKYRVVQYYHNFFAHHANRLERLVRYKFLCWEWERWEFVEKDALGIHGNDWSEHYNCEWIDEKDLEE